MNGTPVLSSDSMWLNDQQVQLTLREGLNVIEIQFRNTESRPPVFLYDPLGQPLTMAQVADEAGGLQVMAAAYDKEQADLGDAVVVQALPNQLRFTPAEVRVKAGAPVHLIFKNPDVMLHNLLIVEPGATEEIGTLADLLASQPDGLAREYIPTSAKVLHATPLVQPGQEAKLVFTAPTRPGNYPYLCTFPGHWRLMRGTLIVE
jgi:azurin